MSGVLLHDIHWQVFSKLCRLMLLTVGSRWQEVRGVQVTLEVVTGDTTHLLQHQHCHTLGHTSTHTSVHSWNNTYRAVYYTELFLSILNTINFTVSPVIACALTYC